MLDDLVRAQKGLSCDMSTGGMAGMGTRAEFVAAAGSSGKDGLLSSEQAGKLYDTVSGYVCGLSCRDYYDELGLGEAGATKSDRNIKKAFHKQSLVWHPDKCKRKEAELRKTCKKKDKCLREEKFCDCKQASLANAYEDIKTEAQRTYCSEHGSISDLEGMVASGVWYILFSGAFLFSAAFVAPVILFVLEVQTCCCAGQSFGKFLCGQVVLMKEREEYLKASWKVMLVRYIAVRAYAALTVYVLFVMPPMVEDGAFCTKLAPGVALMLAPLVERSAAQRWPFDFLLDTRVVYAQDMLGIYTNDHRVFKTSSKSGF